MVSSRIRKRTFKAYGRKDIDRIPELGHLSRDERLAIKTVSAVLPFRVNNYVVEELIRWNNIPDDPLYQLTFPQPGMLSRRDFAELQELVAKDAPDAVVQNVARKIQMKMNPHPAGQMELNVPRLAGEPLPGMQHKYRETVLFFPSQGQTCHAYCTYCFRWAQFVGIDELKFANREAESLVQYLKGHPEVHSVLFTGGDPLIMKTRVLRRYVEPLLDPELEHIISIRIGTKATAYWPNRFLTDPDADDLMRLFQDVRRAGKHLALMSHYSHPRELDTAEAQAAVRRIHASGAIVRCQAPVIKHVNDNANSWADMWRMQVRLGAVPYYMFVERDTGPKNYFEVPLLRAYEIFRKAYRRVSGLARTARGPSMSATPGKVVVEGMMRINSEEVFVLKFVQARNPEWVGMPFFAKLDPKASWLDDLEPAMGDSEFFFSKTMRQIKRNQLAPAWGDRIARRRRTSVFGHVEWE